MLPENYYITIQISCYQYEFRLVAASHKSLNRVPYLNFNWSDNESSNKCITGARITGIPPMVCSLCIAH
jgi:hypothetical protein